MDYETARRHAEKIWGEFIDLERELHPVLYGNERNKKIEELCDVIMENIGSLWMTLGRTESRCKKWNRDSRQGKNETKAI